MPVLSRSMSSCSRWLTPAGLPRSRLSPLPTGQISVFTPTVKRPCSLLQAGFGDAPLQAVKDPRLCLTLPFWLALCAELGLPTRVCVISRAPLEVARSLEKRDDFPLGYGLRLYARYQACIDCIAPPDTLFVRYDELVQDAASVLEYLATALPLDLKTTEVTRAVRGDLRHHQVSAEGDLLSQSHKGKLDLAALQDEIERRFPIDETLSDFSRRFTTRGLELAQIGDAHTAALATIDERDADIEALSVEHRQALATIDRA